MREIKFRAWVPAYNWFITNITKIEFGVLIEGEYNENNVSTVQDFILMQYTGLKDKNGKEIYEGDIMQNTDCIPLRTFVVKWMSDEEHACFYLYEPEDNETWWFEHFSPIGMEVIGNIYEDKELLEGTK